MPDAENTPLPPLTLGRSLWAIDRELLPRLIAAHRGGRAPLERLTARTTAAAPRVAVRRPASARAGGAVAVIPLTGMLTPRGSFLSLLFGGGGGGLIDFRESFRDALNDPDVGAIVLDVDSPGGLVDLTPETAEEVFEARGTKPIVAVSNTLAASGAYFIASQADEFVVTPSGSVGSIGVYMVHEDWSGWNEKAGIAPTYISAGKYKTEGNLDEPLSDDAREVWQEDVDDLYAMFVDAVARGRGVSTDVVRDGYGEGRVLYAERAFAAGMVDRVDTIETVIGGLLSPGSTGTAAARAARVSRIEAVPPPAGEETAAGRDQPTPGPSRVEPPTVEPPTVEPPAEPVEPDVGPDAVDPAQARAFVDALIA